MPREALAKVNAAGKQKHSLLLRASLLTAAAVMLVFALFGAVAYWSVTSGLASVRGSVTSTARQVEIELRTSARKAALERGGKMADLMAEIVPIATADLDRVSLSSFAEIAVKVEDVAYVRYHTPDGRVLAEAGEKPGPDVETRTVKRVIVVDDVKLGELEMVLNFAHADRYGEVIEGSFTTILADLAMAAETQNSSLQSMIMLSAVVAAVALFLLSYFTLSRSVFQALYRIAGFMQRLARGEAQAEQVPELGRADEIGRMAECVAVFQKNTGEMIRLAEERAESERRIERARRETIDNLMDSFEESVAGMVNSVAQGAQRMRSTAETMASAGQKTVKRSQMIASGTADADRNVQTVSSATEQLSASVREVGQQVERASSIARTASERATGTNDKMRQLEKAAYQIGNIAQMINEIAGKTHLLALNATIEAARAGEAGKGFAVVAGEVKKLATQTASATDNISASIGAVQHAAAEALQEIGEITDIIGQLNEIAGAIATAVDEQSAATLDIARSAEHAAAGTQEIAKIMSEVEQVASDTGSTADNAFEVAVALSEQSDRMREEMERFLGQVRVA